MSWIFEAWKLGGLDGEKLRTFKGSVFPLFLSSVAVGVLRKAFKQILSERNYISAGHLGAFLGPLGGV